MGFWIFMGVCALVGVVLKVLDLVGFWNIVGAIVVGLIASAVIALVISFFGADFAVVFHRAALVLPALCVIYEIFF